MATLNSFYPVLEVHDPRRAADFFVSYFGFEATFLSDWYVSLARDPAYELAFLAHDHPTIPEGFGSRVAGVLLNLEVPDATAEYDRLVRGAGLTCPLALRDEPFGQRHFILEGPERILVDVIENIPPSGEFAAQYAE
ncbi:VOC family protein [Microbacterium awajiense]|uniref:VOC family protein n=1 Tax=Microbacterium awajiense TaxID=415214 RepID=A0ABP7A455_9MICO